MRRTKRAITLKTVVIIKDIPAYNNTCSKVEVKIKIIEMTNCIQNDLIGIPLAVFELKIHNIL